MSMFVSRCIVKADGTVVFPGIDYSGAKLTVHQRDREHLVVKIGGSKCWNGIGADQIYVPARFAVYRITGKAKPSQRYMSDTGEELPIAQIVEFPIKAGVK